MNKERPTRVCDKHIVSPAVIHRSCVGCELEWLHAEVERLNAELDKHEESKKEARRLLSILENEHE